MVRTFKTLALVGAFSLVASTAFAEMTKSTPVGDFDLDPFNILAPAAPPAPAAAPAAPAPMKKKHHMKKHMKKKMM